MTIIRWLISGSVRDAVSMCRHVWKLLQHQRDILKPDAVSSIETVLAETRTALRDRWDKGSLRTQVARLEEVANKHLKPYPNPGWRENVEVLLVALAVAMSIRTFFLQPFKIPTGSMQPTLYGVTSENLGEKPDVKPPKGLERIREWFSGASYVHFVADQDGTLDRVEPPFRLLIFNIKQTIWYAGRPHTFWFPPDCGSQTLDQRAGVRCGEFFRSGQDVFNVRVCSGDHLFVDRLTYNFRAPKRGEIIVFETKGISQLPPDQFYIKRMVGMGGERIQIGNDRHLRINGTNRLDASTPHFEFVYGFDPKRPPLESRFSGHVNQQTASGYGYNAADPRNPFAPLFVDDKSELEIPRRELIVMGDNTMNSSDSRFWGSFPADNVIGRSCFVYWPLSARFGWANILH